MKLRHTLLAGLAAAVLSSAAPVAADHIKTGPDLRVAVNLLLAEHVNLASTATGWAMMGMTNNFEAAAGGLDENSKALAGAIGLVYGEGAEEAFLPLWRKHIGFFVDYTMATANQDGAGRKAATDALMGYAVDFGAFLNSANPNLPAEAVADLVRQHAVTLTAVIDAQANQDWPRAYALQAKAEDHMQMISDALAGAIVTQFPEKFGS